MSIPFKVGDEVELVAHKGDSSDNLTLGETGIIIEIDEGKRQTIRVEWRNARWSRKWWVYSSIISLFNLDLTNE